VSSASVTGDPTADRGENVREVGAIVVDADDEPGEQDPAVVVNLPPVAAEEWVAYHDDGEEVTVADDNPEYDASAEVVVVVFREDLENAHPEYDGAEQLPLAGAECRTYAFPPQRLQRVGTFAEGDTTDDSEEDASEPRDRLTDGQEALRERLEDAGDVRVEGDPTDPEAAVLVLEKLGAEHVVDADGAVEGGPLGDRLENLAAEYLGGGSA
jgi:hypothetical protein